MSIREDYYDLHQAIRMGNTMHIYSVCSRISPRVAFAVDVAKRDKREPISLELRLRRYKRVGLLFHKRCRV